MKSTSFDIPIALKQLITSNQAFTHRVVPVSKQGNTVVFKSDSDTPKLLEKKSLRTSSFGQRALEIR